MTMQPKIFTDTRAGLLKLSASWIAKRGYHGTSLSELLRVTGIGKGGFYYHFSSKEQLLTEIMLAPIEGVIASGNAIVERGGTPTECIAALGKDLGRSVGEDLDSWIAFLREYSALGAEAKERVLGCRTEYLGQWYQIIELGQHSGEFRRIDLAFVESILGIFVYTFVWSSGEKSSEELVASVMDMLLNGLAQRT